MREVEPLVSVIIPCRGERSYISRCLRALLNGTVKEIEVIVVDGISEDGTYEIVAAIGREDDRVRLLRNPARVTPVALNMGIQAARGRHLAILGAHSEPAPDWIERNLQALGRNPEAAAVGGVLETVGDTLIGRVIATVLSSPFGVGNARFRVGGNPGDCDTVVFGCYRRQVFDRYGYFNEQLTTNQDDDFNIRLLAGGLRLHFDPAIRCRYYSRSTWRKALNQFWRYGFYKVRVFRNNKRIGSWRQVVPAVWVTFLAFAWPVVAILPVLRGLVLSVVALYLILGIAFAARNGRQCVLGALLFLPVAASLHCAYGLGTLCGAVDSLVTTDRGTGKTR